MARVRIEIERYTPKYKRTRSRQLKGSDGRFMIIYEDNEHDALAEIRSLRNAGVFENGFGFKKASLYDADKFNEDPLKAKPFKVVTEP